MSPGREKPHRWGRICVVLAILALAAAIRLYQVSFPLVWVDEAYSVRLSQLSVERIAYHTTRDVHPPLYYWALHYWMLVFGTSELACRGLSVAAGTLTVGVGMLLALRLSTARAAVMAGLLLALLPSAVRYSQEVRMYALLALLLLSATYQLWRWTETRRGVYLAGYGSLMIAGIYTHYFTVPCAVAHWAFLLLAGRGELLRMRSWWVCNLAIGIAFLPWLPHLHSQWGHRQTVFGWIEARNPPGFLSLPATAWFALVSGDETTEPPVLFSVLLLLPLWVASKRLAGRAAQPGMLLICYCFIPVLLTWAVSQVMQLYIVRYLLFALIGLPLLLACAIDTFPRRAWIAALAGCVLMQLLGLVNHYQRQAVEQPGAVMARINDQWRPGDGILAIDLWAYYSVGFYNSTRQGAMLYTRNPPPTTLGLYSLLYRHAEQLYIADPQRLVGRFKRVWLVSWSDPTPLEHQLRATWHALEQVHDPRLRAVLFAVPDAPTNTAGVDQIDNGSKLSARAMLHMRE